MIDKDLGTMLADTDDLDVSDEPQRRHAVVVGGPVHPQLVPPAGRDDALPARSYRSGMLRLSKSERLAHPKSIRMVHRDVFKKHSGRELNGRIYDELPDRVVPLGAVLVA